jgi:hypothetical protein
MFSSLDLSLQVAGDRRTDLERRASNHRLSAGGSRRRHDAPGRRGSTNVVGLSPPRTDRDATGHDLRVA